MKKSTRDSENSILDQSPDQTSKKKKKGKKEMKELDLCLQPVQTVATKSKKAKKTKKPKEPEPELEPVSPYFITTNVTVKKTKVSSSTIIATTATIDDPKHQINLYLCISTSSGRFHWCTIDPNKDSETKSKDPSLLSPICSMSKSTPQNFRAVTDSNYRVYAIGGIRSNSKPSSKAYVCDFTSASPNWEKIPHMSSPKLCPVAATSPLDGRVYVLGSFSDEFAEVLDPSSNSWTTMPLPPPPDPPGAVIIDCAFVIDRNELIVFSNTNDKDCCTHSLNLTKTDSSWKYIPVHGEEQASYCFAKSKSVVVGNVVYTLRKRSLYAFHLSMDEPCLVPVSGIEKATTVIDEDDSVFLVYIGVGKICLVSCNRKHSDGLLHITCSKFSVGTYHRKKQFHAVALLESCEEYVAEGSDLQNCLAI